MKLFHLELMYDRLTGKEKEDLRNQVGSCEICGSRDALEIDHFPEYYEDERAGKVRGAICRPDNQGLSYAENGLEGWALPEFAEYLEISVRDLEEYPKRWDGGSWYMRTMNDWEVYRHRRRMTRRAWAVARDYTGQWADEIRQIVKEQAREELNMGGLRIDEERFAAGGVRTLSLESLL